MLAEELATLAAAAGTAVAQAAGTSAWHGLEHAVARWLGHGDEEREQAELERLAESERALTTASSDDLPQVRISQQTAWQARFESAFQIIAQGERDEAASALQMLLKGLDTHDTSAANEGIAVGGNADIRADHGAVAALRIGDVTLNNPPSPGPHQG